MANRDDSLTLLAWRGAAKAVAPMIQMAVPRWRQGEAAVRVVVIDGPAGSGKTSFATALRYLVRAPVIHMDDLYRGWSGLEGSWNYLAAGVLRPFAQGKSGRFRRYDWLHDHWGDWVEVPWHPILVVEGCGSARLEADEVACLRVWVEASDELRLARGIARDGEDMRPHWITWMAAEAEHFARNRTRERADVRLDAWGRGEKLPSLRPHGRYAGVASVIPSKIADDDAVSECEAV